MPAWGYDFPPGRVAIQAQAAPWGPSWLTGLIDDKPVGFEETSTETTRGNFRPPLWRRTWLGKWCGLGSADIRGGTVDVLAHWVRKPEKAKRLEDLGSLTVRYCANKPDLVTTGGGITAQAGLTLTYQSRNRAIVFAKPHGNRQRFLDAAGNEVSQLATVIGLWNFNAAPNWEIRIDDRKVETLPQRATSQQKILIRDGVTYLAIRPLPASDLGRDAEIEIGRGGGGKADPTGAEVAPALIVSLALPAMVGVGDEGQAAGIVRDEPAAWHPRSAHDPLGLLAEHGLPRNGHRCTGRRRHGNWQRGGRCGVVGCLAKGLDHVWRERPATVRTLGADGIFGDRCAAADAHAQRRPGFLQAAAPHLGPDDRLPFVGVLGDHRRCFEHFLI